METRDLIDHETGTRLAFSVMGLGTWAMGGGGWKFAWGPQDDRESIRTIHRAMECGVNWIDTAPLYGLGHAELVIGKALKAMPRKPYIATKCGIAWDDRRRAAHCLDPDSIRRELEQSLRRLKAGTIDYYQIHWPSPEDKFREAWETLQALKKEGKIRCAGVCNASAGHLRQILPAAVPSANQYEYNLVRRTAEKELIPCMAEHSIAGIAYGVLRKGFLCGTFTRERISGLAFDDHRKHDSWCAGPEQEKAHLLMASLAGIAARNDRTLSQLMLAWALSRNKKGFVLCGARRPEQIEENARAVECLLTEEEEKLLTQVAGNWTQDAGH